MSKYIKLEDAIHNINLEVVGRKEYTGDMKANLFFALDDLPTIEIVLCKDCTFYTPLDESRPFDCSIGLVTAMPTDFCSYGERKEE